MFLGNWGVKSNFDSRIHRSSDALHSLRTNQIRYVKEELCPALIYGPIIEHRFVLSVQHTKVQIQMLGRKTKQSKIDGLLPSLATFLRNLLLEYNMHIFLRHLAFRTQVISNNFSSA